MPGRPVVGIPAQTTAILYSCEGKTLTDRERGFFASAKPFGFILFARNCDNPRQLRALTDSLREAAGYDCPILIDQEGGRVQRLKPPAWRQYPPAQSFGDMALNSLDKSLETIRFETLQIAQDLVEAGINVNCAPVLDVLHEETHDVIGDRAFSTDPAVVSRLGLSVCRQYLAAGITPVIKHIPGHGRAAADSHKDLPVVKASLQELEKTDFLPFREVAASDCGRAVWGMMAHVVYTAIDPEYPASISPTLIEKTVRGAIGFDGLLLSDDLSMEALAAYGDLPARALAVLKAGCDVALYCAGKLPEMEKIAQNAPKLGEKAILRLQKAAEFRKVAA